MTSQAPLIPEKVFPWMQETVRQFGTDILRLKWIIQFQDDPDRFVIQGVHMLLEGDHQRPWKPDEPRTSQSGLRRTQLARGDLEGRLRAVPGSKSLIQVSH